MAGNLTSQVRNIAEVITAIAQGDLGHKIAVDARGEILTLKNTINATVDKLNRFAAEVNRMARLVGTEGTLGVQADVKDVSGVWKELTDNVNLMGRNLTDQVRDIAGVTTAVANGDLSKKITVEVKGELLQLKNTINAMVDSLGSFAAEVTRMAREVGTEGVLGGQAVVRDVAGIWLELTQNVNSMASNLTNQVRNIADVARAVANGDLSKTITVGARGEVLELKNVLNAMVDQLNAFSAEVTRVAREVGVEGRLGGQAEVPGRARRLEGADRQRQPDGQQPHQSGARHRHGDDGGGASGDLTRKIMVDAKGEILELKNTINTMVDQLSAFADQVTRLATEVGTEGKLGGQADVRGVAGHVAPPDRRRQLDGQQPDRAGAQHLAGRDRHRPGRSAEEDRRRRARRDPRAEEHHQHHGRSAERVRRSGDARGARGRHRGQAGRPGLDRRRARHLEGPDRQRQLDGVEPDQPGARHRRGGHRRRAAATCRRRSPSTCAASCSS